MRRCTCIFVTVVQKKGRFSSHKEIIIINCLRFFLSPSLSSSVCCLLLQAFLQKKREREGATSTTTVEKETLTNDVFKSSIIFLIFFVVSFFRGAEMEGDRPRHIELKAFFCPLPFSVGAGERRDGRNERD